MTIIVIARLTFREAARRRILLAALEERGVLESTIVIAVADHGEGLGDHGWWGHTILYQEQIRVPMIVRWPGITDRQQGRVDDALYYHVD